MVTRCRLAALAFSVAFVGSLPTAFAAGFTAECVSDYSIYGAGSVPANCASASGLVSTLTGGGHSNTSFWTDYDVWDTDMVDLSVYAYGGDYNYTDRADARLYYFAGHGQCNYGKEVSGPPCSGGSCAPGLSCELGHCIKHCSSDTDCTSPQRCQVGAPNSSERYCSTPAQAVAITSSPTNFFSNTVYITTKTKFGESSSSGNWAGAGTDGGVEVFYLDTSCPMQPAFHWYRYSAVFAGLHIVLGQMAYTGDTLASDYRGTNYSNRLLAGQPVAVAMKNTFLAENAVGPSNPPEAGYPFQGYGCAVAIACARDTLAAQIAKTGLGWRRLQSETWPNNGALAANTSSPNYCPYIETCNFTAPSPPFP